MSVFDGYTRKLAAKFAHSLPERIEGTLFILFCMAEASQRPIINSGDDYYLALLSTYETMKVEIEAAERSSGIEIAEETVLTLYIYFHRQIASCDLAKLTNLVAEAIRTRAWQSLSAPKLEKADHEFRFDLYRWLHQCGIPWQGEQSIRLAASEVLRIVTQFQGNAGFHVAPGIPFEKLKNASETCGLPDLDEAFALIDCTFWGSAKDALIIGSRGIYFNQNVSFGFLPYSTLVKHSALCRDAKRLQIGDSFLLNINGSSFPLDDLLNLVDKLKRSALARERGSSTERPEGLKSVKGWRRTYQCC